MAPTAINATTRMGEEHLDRTRRRMVVILNACRRSPAKPAQQGRIGGDRKKDD